MNREEIEVLSEKNYWLNKFRVWSEMENEPEEAAEFISKKFASLTHTEGEKEFKVYTLSTYEGKSEWSHWSKGLTMIVKKDGITLELKGEELKELVKSLPRTFGGTY